MDLLEFVQDIDNREWIEYRNIEKLTIVFLQYLQLIPTTQEEQVSTDLKKIAKVYSKTPKQFIVKIQEKYSILQELNMDNKWISVIHEIFSRSAPVKDFQISIKEKIIQEYQYEDEYDDSYDYQDSFLNVEHIQEPDEIEENTPKEVVKTSKKNHNRKTGHYRKLQKGMGGNF
jgi:hypothetical protein